MFRCAVVLQKMPVEQKSWPPFAREAERFLSRALAQTPDFALSLQSLAAREPTASSGTLGNRRFCQKSSASRGAPDGTRHAWIEDALLWLWFHPSPAGSVNRRYPLRLFLLQCSMVSATLIPNASVPALQSNAIATRPGFQHANRPPRHAALRHETARIRAGVGHSQPVRHGN